LDILLSRHPPHRVSGPTFSMSGQVRAGLLRATSGLRARDLQSQASSMIRTPQRIESARRFLCLSAVIACSLSNAPDHLLTTYQPPTAFGW